MAQAMARPGMCGLGTGVCCSPHPCHGAAITHWPVHVLLLAVGLLAFRRLGRTHAIQTHCQRQSWPVAGRLAGGCFTCANIIRTAWESGATEI